MKNFVKCSMIVAAVAALSTAWQRPQAAAQAMLQAAPRTSPNPVASRRIRWQSSWGAAIREAKRTGKPIFVDFYATWCGPCKLLDRHVYTNRKIVDASRKWVMLKVDAERNTQLAQANKVTAFPTLIFYSPTGKAVVRKMGFEVTATSERATIKQITQQTLRTMNYAHGKALKRGSIRTSLSSS
ncbi:MAG TPA: thioredoxin family protein [Abditibacteriaceae bacterium]|jgi:thiol:disulfide interchange protein